MSSPYTDRYGYPLTATQVAARMQHPKSLGYYDAKGKWRRTAKRTVPVKAVEAGRDGAK